MEESLYTKTYQFNEKRKNIGFNYADNILKNSLSSHLYSKPHIKGFLDKLEVAITHLVNSVKVLKNYHNFTVPKDDMNTPK